MSVQSQALAPLDPTHIPIPSKIVALVGPETQLDSLLQLSLFTLAERGARIGIIIGNNRLDVRALARLAHRRGLDARPLLERLELSRAETCHQLHQCIMTLPLIKESEWNALFVSGFLDNFYDETPKYYEAQWLLNQTLIRLREIAARGLPVVITLSGPKHAGREKLMELVARRVDVYQELADSTLPLPPPRHRVLGS